MRRGRETIMVLMGKEARWLGEQLQQGALVDRSGFQIFVFLLRRGYKMRIQNQVFRMQLARGAAARRGRLSLV